MKLKHIIAAAAVAVMPLAAQATTYVVPGVGAGPGANGSQWKTELKLHASGTQYINVAVRLHQGRFVTPDHHVRVEPSHTVSLDSELQHRLNIAGTGALLLSADDKNSRRLSATARVYNVLPNGDELGQDVPVIPVDEAAMEGDMVIVAGPTSAARTRFNFGLFSVTASRVTWDLLRANGSAITSRTVTYTAGEHIQYNNGVETFFRASREDGDTIRAVVDSGKIFVYGSAIDRSGDPTYIPGVRTREQFDLIFDGVDIDEDGTVDIPDANNDGVLDRPLEIVTSLFPASVKVIAHTEFGVPIRGGLALISSTSDAEFVDFQGTLMIGAAGDLKGKTGEIRIRAHADASNEVFIIPVKFL
ncbi:MAG TPA: hypothetical protein VGF48_11535 [Thermoanaerobaculia bacterium]|jgi:hypothetical protein